MEMTKNGTHLREFRALVEAPQCVDWCAQRIGVPSADVRSRVIDYTGEVPVSLSLNGFPLERRRILDVGAASGLRPFICGGSGATSWHSAA